MIEKQIKISEIKRNPANPRVIRDEKYTKLLNSLLVFPKMLQARPIVVDKQMVVLGGNMRLKALQEIATFDNDELFARLSKINEFKEKEKEEQTAIFNFWVDFNSKKLVNVVIADDFTDKEASAFIIKDNNNYGEWDNDMLANWDADLLKDWGVDIFDFEDLSDTGNAEIIEDDVPEIQEEPKSKLGDIYQLGRHRLICGDSTDIAVIDRLMDGVKADMVFTDPPYQLDTQGGGILKSANSMKQIKQNGVDSFDPSRLTMWSDTNIFCHNKPLIKAYIELAENNNMPYDLAFYKKKNTVPNYKGHLMTDVEYIAIIGKQDPNKGLDKEMYSKCFIGQKDNDNELSYSKPVALCAKYIQLYSKKTVLDLFGGSGSTLIACEQLNRKCYMAELDPKYVSVIVSRWLNFTGRKDEIFCIRDGQKLTYDEVFKGTTYFE